MSIIDLEMIYDIIEIVAVIFRTENDSNFLQVELLLNAWRKLLNGIVYDFVQWFEDKLKLYEKANPIIDDIKDFKER